MVVFFDSGRLSSCKSLPPLTGSHRPSGDKSLEAPLAQLLKDADEKLSAGPFSVTAKKSPPPSGNLHDYCPLGCMGTARIALLQNGNLIHGQQADILEK